MRVQLGREEGNERSFKEAYFNEFFGREGWCFVLVQEVVMKLGETAIHFPPMQAPASFNLSAVKEKIQAAIKANEGR